jgi:hypothetical protein
MASQITECLAATLSPDTNTRISAELRLAELFASPGSFNLSKRLQNQTSHYFLRRVQQTRDWLYRN